MGRAVGAQRLVLHFEEPKKKGARARTLGKNLLIVLYISFARLIYDNSQPPIAPDWALGEDSNDDIFFLLNPFLSFRRRQNASASQT